MTKAAKKKSKGQGRVGHPTMFEGPREKLSVKVTTEARELVESTRSGLRAAYGTAATTGAAVEFLIRKATKVPGSRPTPRPVVTPPIEDPEPIEASASPTEAVAIEDEAAHNKP